MAQQSIPIKQPGINPMNRLANKNILLGISGGIAAYKSAELVRRLREQHANVRVIMTKAAREFITPLTLQALSANPVHCDLLDTAAEAAMGHIELARWADALLVAPASANCLAHIAQGLADDLLTTLILALDAPLAVAPAMNQAMWRNPATQANIAVLQQRGVHIFGPASGSQACGDVGPGRMLEVEQLVQHLDNMQGDAAMSGLRVVITAGPTREAIDPVRFISNHSSGKMGYAMASAARDAGAHTTLISGPVSLAAPHGVSTMSVTSAAQMYAASLELAPQCDIFISTAAVADYRPQHSVDQKIKKNHSTMQLELTRNPDIISTVADLANAPFCIGFAAETQNVVTYAREKLLRKQLDMIIANDVSDSRIGFNSDDNCVTLVTKDKEVALPRDSKQRLAQLLIAEIATSYEASREL